MTKMQNLYEYCWIALLIAIIGDICIPYILKPFYQEYSHSMMSISVLGNHNSPVRIPFNIMMFIEGILFISSVPAVYSCYHRVSCRLTVVLIVFIVIYAIGACIFTSFFSVNETNEMTTIAMKIHGVGSVTGFTLFVFVPLIVGILSFKNKNNLTGSISIVTFILAFVSLVLFVMSDKPEFTNTVIAKTGLWQRLNILFMHIPLGYISVLRINHKL